MLKQLSSAMHYLQVEKRMLHRDIKATNILVAIRNNNSNEPVLKLSDFGLAIALGNDSLAHTMTGTPFYLAPEVLSYKPYGRPADIFSLGISS